MSKSVSNAEIEDVLSSIRRLVNEESRNTLINPKSKAETKASRLVLTPALRVEDRGDDGPIILTDQINVDESPDEADSDIEATPHETEFSSQRTISPDEAAAVLDGLDGHSEDAVGDPDATDLRRPEVTNDGTHYLGDDFIFAREAEIKARAEQRQQNESAETDEDPDYADMALEGLDVDSESNADDGSEAVTVADREETADQDDTDAAPWKDPEATLYAAASSLERGTESQADEPTLLEEVRSAPLGSKIEAFEAAIGKTQDQWEPDGDVGDDYAGTHVETIEWEDHEDTELEEGDPDQYSELDMDAEDALEPSEPVDELHIESDEYDDEALDVLASDENFLDEESLRELVADIVRQELQGALGERITRNVRKLVRREIHRALVAQELD
jgi:hypothetical protein